MAKERLYLVTYDISDQKRWRKVFRVMNGFGHWVQLSVFQCRLAARRRADMTAKLDKLIERGRSTPGPALSNDVQSVNVHSNASPWIMKHAESK